MREHMEAENALEMDRALATFAHPRYEIMSTGRVYDGPEEVDRYYRESRAAFPDQRNELISLRHADDAVIVEFWLLGTHKGAARAPGADGTGIQVPDDGVLYLRGNGAGLRAGVLRFGDDPAAADIGAS